ncbi:hypothetical protein K439DRAFT_1664025 [Ramaria rubella]|nr:hypothetical protein K439DRAFT_1664025 [Ramaria rubella]
MDHHDQDERIDDFSILTTGQARNLYVSHFLSTWNARLYEFASILFTASAYPNTLAAASIRGIITTIALLIFSPSVGAWIDRTPSRLKTLIGTITANRSATIIACICWLPLLGSDNKDELSNEVADHHNHSGFFIYSKTLSPSSFLSNVPTLSGSRKDLVFIAVLVIGILEKLSGSANMISMERDWVPTIAPQIDSEPAHSHTSAYTLTRLNAVMRRIDLLCKLFSPVLISLIISFAGSVRVGAVVVGGMSVASWGLEWWCALRVWRGSPQLRRPKISVLPRNSQVDAESQQPAPFLGHLLTWLQGYLHNVKQYFDADVWMPSIALALLHLSMLSYSAPFITHLLNAGYSLPLISGARAVSSIFEVSSTLVMPWGARVLSRPRRNIFDAGTEDRTAEESQLLAQERPDSHQSGKTTVRGLSRLGLWGLWGQLICLIPVVFVLWNVSGLGTGLSNLIMVKLFPSKWVLESFTLFFFLSLSRVGLWTYDLTAQQLAQTRVPSHQRSSFAGTEYSFIALFDLLNYVAAAILSATEQFRWLTLVSLGAVVTSTAIYSLWLKKERGHLVHLDKIGLQCLGDDAVIHLENSTVLTQSYDCIIR